MTPYSPSELETKWQARWAEKQVYSTPNPGDPGFDGSKPSYYVLDMFPYPSGSGLHVGHASGYIGTDIVARRKRMEGYNVLHPMGWDAFGLPAEQYAIQHGQHPRTTTDINVGNFRRQLKLLGLSYDWNREIDTSAPEYYKWTQWLFLKIYEKGLVYQKEVAVWWCEELKTVLANEEVIQGRSERGNYPCVRRPLKQWVLKITAYADRLINDLEALDWPEGIKKSQREWIGRSLGAEIDFAVINSSLKIRVFTSRPDTLFGVTALVLAPEHPQLRELTQPDQKEELETYIATAASKADLERKAETREISGAFTGSYAAHPLLPDCKIPIYAADYVLAEYGTGAVMSVPAHDERDFIFARSQNLSAPRVIGPPDSFSGECFTGDGTLENSGKFTGLSSSEARAQIVAELERRKAGHPKVAYKLKDWVFSRQRYWGEPFPLSFDAQGQIVAVNTDELPVLLPHMDDFTPSSDGLAPLARVPEWVHYTSAANQALTRSTDTMPGWAGSCWYFLRFMDPKNASAPFSQEAVNYWKQVDLYVGGTAHAVMHLLYARFWHKVFFDVGLVPTPEPFKKLFNQGMVTAYAYKDRTGRLVPNDEVETDGTTWWRKSSGEPIDRIVTKMAKSLKNVVNPDDVIQNYGCDTLRIYEMFIGPLEDDKPWTDEGLPGCERFLKRVWNLFHEEILPSKTRLSEAAEFATEQALHRCLKRVDDSFSNFNFNIAVAAFMEFLNHASKNPGAMTKAQASFFLRMLSPFCPHIAAELWEKLGHTDFIDFQSWPSLRSEMLEDETFELVISLNGKPRKRVQARRGTDSPELERIARNEAAALLEGKTVVKVIVVPDKLVNLVIK